MDQIYHFDFEAKSIYNRVHQYILERYQIHFNEVSLSYEINNLTNRKRVFELNENSLIILLDQAEIKISKEKFVNYLKSDLVVRYNPIQRYFEDLAEWDGFDYIKQYCSYAKTDNDELFHYHMKKWAVRAIKSVLLQDEINKHAIILANGEQNAGKSTYLKKLVPPTLMRYYGENLSLDKDGRIKLCKTFILNLEELEALNKQDTDKVKAMLSLQTVNDRLPFDSKNSFLSRTCSFVGSTNKSEFLVDETGNVRWIVFEVIGTIDYERYNREFDINKFWAQAYHIFKNVETFNSALTADDVRLNEERNEKFMILSIECEAVLKYYEQSEDIGDFRTSSEVVHELAFTGIRMTNMKIGSALKKYGYLRIKHPKRQVYGYLARLIIPTLI
ncbi:VapE domain-containing protein [Pedobacter jejuensis]|uniref:Virulence-associated E family protein n=1 Tax=Pedobacter jejuensis TaxID=1268550 RepID=A0A3N0C1Z1_9SPHI|nr:VapE domain-containing protein [Pedobacter jejuensis]RNL56434.1 virulence-associated E family protein [Pedobacter jejuensis]